MTTLTFLFYFPCLEINNINPDSLPNFKVQISKSIQCSQPDLTIEHWCQHWKSLLPMSVGPYANYCSHREWWQCDNDTIMGLSCHYHLHLLYFPSLFVCYCLSYDCPYITLSISRELCESGTYGVFTQLMWWLQIVAWLSHYHLHVHHFHLTLPLASPPPPYNPSHLCFCLVMAGTCCCCEHHHPLLALAFPCPFTCCPHLNTCCWHDVLYIVSALSLHIRLY